MELTDPQNLGTRDAWGGLTTCDVEFFIIWDSITFFVNMGHNY